MLTTPQVAYLCYMKAISDAVADRVGEIRTEYRPELNRGDRLNGVINGILLGTVEMTKPRPATLSVVDWGELTLWVMNHVPTAMVTPSPTVNQSWVERVLRAGGTWTHPETGEEITVPGIALKETEPQLRVIPSDDAKMLAGLALERITETPAAITARPMPATVSIAVDPQEHGHVHLVGEPVTDALSTLADQYAANASEIADAALGGYQATVREICPRHRWTDEQGVTHTTCRVCGTIRKARR